MAAYLVTEIEITDPAGYEEYRKGVGATLAAYGGRNLVRPGGKMEVLEGDWVPKRLVILEFPSIAQLKAWYDSPEYQEILPLRLKSTPGTLIVAKGFTPS